MYKNLKTENDTVCIDSVAPAGFVAVGAMGTTSMEEQTADNSQQAANAIGTHHDAMKSYLQSPRKGLNKKRNEAKTVVSVTWLFCLGRPTPRQEHSQGSRRWYQCQRSKKLERMARSP